jgi:hypothetical protein
VTGYDRLLGLTSRLVGARYPGRGEEIVATARSAGRDGGTWTRLAELASLVALALQPRHPRASAREVWLHGAGLAGLLAATTVVAPAPGYAVVVPFVLLASGVLDARLAAAATVFWLWRLTTVDIADVVRALGDVSFTTQLLRWFLMLIAIVVAARVTRNSIRRAASL